MKSVRILPVLMSLLLLAGCTMPSGDELLAAPKPPGNYQTLQTKLEELLASGVSYTTPTTGENRSSVQLVDLDGDGAEEAIVFFRGATSATSNDFKVYIYKKNGDDYRCTGSIEAKEPRSSRSNIRPSPRTAAAASWSHGSWPATERAR